MTTKLLTFSYQDSAHRMVERIRKEYDIQCEIAPCPTGENDYVYDVFAVTDEVIPADTLAAIRAMRPPIGKR